MSHTRSELIAACLALQDLTYSTRFPYWRKTRAFWLCERALIALGARPPRINVTIAIMRATREIER